MRFIVFAILILTGVSFSSRSQQLESHKFRSTKAFYRSYIDSVQKWGEWREHDNQLLVDMLIVLDLPNRRFSFYAPKQDNYSIVTTFDPKETEKGHLFRFECVDSKNNQCALILVYNKDKLGEPTLYQQYNKFEFCFYLKSEN